MQCCLDHPWAQEQTVCSWQTDQKAQSTRKLLVASFRRMGSPSFKNWVSLFSLSHWPSLTGCHGCQELAQVEGHEQRNSRMGCGNSEVFDHLTDRTCALWSGDVSTEKPGQWNRDDICIQKQLCRTSPTCICLSFSNKELQTEATASKYTFTYKTRFYTLSRKPMVNHLE